MRRPVGMLALAVLLGSAGGAEAQYYAPPPPPYYAPPPPRYVRPEGLRCDSRERTPGGPRQFICDLVEPKPLGAPCRCQLSSPGPGYYPPPPFRGRVIP